MQPGPMQERDLAIGVFTDLYHAERAVFDLRDSGYLDAHIEVATEKAHENRDDRGIQEESLILSAVDASATPGNGDGPDERRWYTEQQQGGKTIVVTRCTPESNDQARRILLAHEAIDYETRTMSVDERRDVLRGLGGPSRDRLSPLASRYAEDENHSVSP